MNEAITGVLNRLAEAQLKQVEFQRLQLEAQSKANELLAQLAGQNIASEELVVQLFKQAKTPDFVPVSHVPEDLGQKGHNQPRKKTAADKVREYLSNHPEDRGLTVRELEEKIGVGKSTISRVLNE